MTGEKGDLPVLGIKWSNSSVASQHAVGAALGEALGAFVRPRAREPRAVALVHRVQRPRDQADESREAAAHVCPLFLKGRPFFSHAHEQTR